MKRLMIVAACCAALIATTGCRNCGKRRGAPCSSSLSFDPYTAAPAAPAVCGVDAYAGPACGQDVVVNCPNCPSGVVEGGVVDGGYYEGGALGSMAPVPMETTPTVPIDPTPPMQPMQPMQPIPRSR